MSFVLQLIERYHTPFLSKTRVSEGESDEFHRLHHLLRISHHQPPSTPSSSQWFSLDGSLLSALSFLLSLSLSLSLFTSSLDLSRWLTP
ncbi:hypothetical protein PRUPE_6G188700 [Prunus persica]|uniref:Uncharacterized protein n=1 Tax=Prunus persica TaxID=3760 RepID=A0A251NSJ7_PRUPE|nr:hypothetical protein PRUPE_6G188700 [Prunus persica]ONI02293.1 hypothetical protein PRUPE_6G188700 [Prunus persica]ONI02294.1 hypothetical protein PRUPE_6G188700 [Prunus persica]